MRKTFCLFILAVILILPTLPRETSLEGRRITSEKISEKKTAFVPFYTNYDLSQATQNAGRLLLRGEIFK